MNYQDLKLDVDAILRGQGADPAQIRTRRPRLVEIASQAMSESLHLLVPRALTRKLKILSLRHNKLLLEDDLSISGEWIVSQFAPAEYLIAVLCTVGSEIDQAVNQTISSDMLLGLAMDGVGSAGVEALAQSICKQVDEQAANENMQTSVPYSPGMLNWSVDEGQPAIFSLLPAESLGMELSPYFVMKPRKSLSMLIGVGRQLEPKGIPCDYCAMQGTCKYREYGGHTTPNLEISP